MIIKRKFEDAGFSVLTREDNIKDRTIKDLSSGRNLLCLFVIVLML